MFQAFHNGTKRWFRPLRALEEFTMGTAQYDVVVKGEGWGVQHNGGVGMAYSTKEAAFEAAVAAASLAIRDGHEVIVRAPSRDAGNKTALGAKDIG
jgi:hypothetical protein